MICSEGSVVKFCYEWHTWNIGLLLLLSDFGASGTRGIFVVFYCYQTLVLVTHVGYSSSFIIIIWF